MKNLFCFLFLVVSVRGEVLRTTTSADGTKVTGVERMPALHVEKGTPPAAGIAPGKFTAEWEGTLKIEQRARLIFSFEGEGTAVLSVEGEEVLKVEGDLGAKATDQIRLNPGEIPLKVTYTSREDGSGDFRLFWEERIFGREPVKTTAFLPMEEEKPDPAHLFAAHNCLKCHASSEPLGPFPMPELSHHAPDLAEIGGRRNEAWLTRWIAQPDKLKPGTHMPAMVNHTTSEGAQEAADLGAYLASLKPEKRPVVSEPGVIEEPAKAGGVHFHKLGCVACHTLPSVSEPDLEFGRVPLNNVAEKFSPGALEAFLKKPTEHWETIKMPDFALSGEEAATLAAFLTSESTGRHTPDPSEFAPGEAGRGEKLAVALNCAACHQGMPEAEKGTAPDFSDLMKLGSWGDTGCLGPDERRGKAPRLILNEAEKEVLREKEVYLPKLGIDTDSAYATRQVSALRCASCHAYDYEEAGLSLLHAETASLIAHIKAPDETLDQSRPQLTYMGSMLNTPYIHGMLDGKIEPDPRPWLEMRMPAFHGYAENLPAGLAAHHGLAMTGPEEFAADPAKVKDGAMLTGTTGYACTICHGIGETPPLAAFEVQGINFDQIHRRLRPPYFHLWMRNPQRINPTTKMPGYTLPDGTALRGDIMDGDAQKQFDAIWHYLKSLDKEEE